MPLRLPKQIGNGRVSNSDVWETGVGKLRLGQARTHGNIPLTHKQPHDARLDQEPRQTGMDSDAKPGRCVPYGNTRRNFPDGSLPHNRPQLLSISSGNFPTLLRHILCFSVLHCLLRGGLLV